MQPVQVLEKMDTVAINSEQFIYFTIEAGV